MEDALAFVLEMGPLSAPDEGAHPVDAAKTEPELLTPLTGCWKTIPATMAIVRDAGRLLDITA